MADAPIRFGVNYLPNAPHDTLRWAQVAEDVGFDIVGIADSQSLYRDVYMCLALCAAETSRVRLGPRVILNFMWFHTRFQVQASPLAASV